MTDNPVEGGCLCGAIRYRSELAPIASVLCHCSSCRRASGAPSLAWLILPAEGFSFTQGEPKTFRSSPHVARGFCDRCGTSILYRSDNRPEVMDVPTATADHPERFPPQREIWLGEKVPWEMVNPELPQFPRSSKG